MSPSTLRFLLGDQLTRTISSLSDLDPATDVVFMAEVQAECTYVGHHKKKIAFILSAMRHFAAVLRAEGIPVDYRCLDDPGNLGEFGRELAAAVERHQVDQVVMTEPGEWRVSEEIPAWEESMGIPIEVRPDSRFLITRQEFGEWASGRTMYRMEHFYRMMRRKAGLLMESDGTPSGSQWNLDQENRKALGEDVEIPRLIHHSPDAITKEVLDLVEERFPDHFGDLEPFWFAVTAEEAEASFSHFIENCLPRFGDFQDAMKEEEATLFHSVLSLYLNVGLLDAFSVCEAVETEYREERAPLNAAEGFIRQVMGWREFVRGIYWLEMPDYADSNYFGASRDLPSFYWTGDTDMNCVRQCIRQTRSEAYAHHIQRLMVTGNFALLAGIEPSQVHEWYLSVYADAFEWVELPNTHGMALFADGGILGSKPYAASGKYIHRMSDYCRNCRYDVSSSMEKDTCPFNVLYWDFLARHRRELEGHPRMGLVYSTLDRMDPGKVNGIRVRAQEFLDGLG